MHGKWHETGFNFTDLLIIMGVASLTQSLRNGNYSWPSFDFTIPTFSFSSCPKTMLIIVFHDTPNNIKLIAKVYSTAKYLFRTPSTDIIN